MYTILLVDDEPMMIKGMQFMLENSQLSGARMHVASNGTEALANLLEYGADVVVTDIRMPDMDGIELARRISSRYPVTPVLIVSGYDEFQYAQEAMRHGVKDFLLKPLSKVHFIAALDTIISGLDKHVHPIGISVDEWRRLTDRWVGAVCERNEEEQLSVEHTWLQCLLYAPPSLSLVWHGIFHESLIQRTWTKLENRIQSVLAPYVGNSMKDLEYWVKTDLGQIAETIAQEAYSDMQRTIHSAKLWIQEHYNKELSLEDLAISLGYSASYFSQLFKQYTGISYLAYRTQVRMNRAKELLSRTDKPITAIAYEVGYTDVAGFIRTFKKEVGFTPSGYRKEGDVE